MVKLNGREIHDLEVDGVDTRDYPKFCDAFFSAGVWADTGADLEEHELDEITELYPEILGEMAYESYL